MITRIFALPVVLVSALVLGAGCTVGVEPAGGVVVADPGPNACFADDSACDVDADCCSNVCAPDGFCGVPADSCQVDNEPCSFDSDCCSNICAGDGFCGVP